MNDSSLAIRVAELQAANNYLSRASRVKPRLRIILQAYADADILAMWHLAGFRTGRKAMQKNGMSDRHWHYGRAMLQVAGVYADDWKSDNPVEIEAALRVAFERCERNPNTLLNRLPASRRLRRRVRE